MLFQWNFENMKYLQMNQILALNNRWDVDMALNKPNLFLSCLGFNKRMHKKNFFWSNVITVIF